MLDKIKNIFEKRESQFIRQDFKIKDGFWNWNYMFYDNYRRKKNRLSREWIFKPDPEIKLSFAFDDTSLLDECQFMGKIGKNLDGDTKYFGIIYGDEPDYEEMISWASRFPRWQILKYSGEAYLKKE